MTIGSMVFVGSSWREVLGRGRLAEGHLGHEPGMGCLGQSTQGVLLSWRINLINVAFVVSLKR